VFMAISFTLWEEAMAATLLTALFAMTPLRTYGALWPSCPQNGVATVLFNDKFILPEVIENKENSTGRET